MFVVSISYSAPPDEIASHRQGHIEWNLDRRLVPLLIRNWTSLWPRESIELSRQGTVLGTGRFDEATVDGNAIWVHLNNGLGRVLIHQHEGIDIWRVDARIRQDRARS